MKGDLLFLTLALPLIIFETKLKKGMCFSLNIDEEEQHIRFQNKEGILVSQKTKRVFFLVCGVGGCGGVGGSMVADSSSPVHG